MSGTPGPLSVEYDPMCDRFAALGSQRGQSARYLFDGVTIKTNEGETVCGVWVDGAIFPWHSAQWRTALRVVLGPELDDVRRQLSQDGTALREARASRRRRRQASVVLRLQAPRLTTDALESLQRVVDRSRGRRVADERAEIDHACVFTDVGLIRPGHGPPSSQALSLPAPFADRAQVHGEAMAELTTTGDVVVHLRPRPGTAACQVSLVDPVGRVGSPTTSEGVVSYTWPRLLADDATAVVLTLLFKAPGPASRPRQRPKDGHGRREVRSTDSA
jgi:hypothetical protein